MNIERMTYNYDKVHECIQVVRNLPLDAKNKKAHEETFRQVAEAYDFYFEMNEVCI